MDLLWVATKPPFPPIDGGRLLLWNTLRALERFGERVTLVAPLDEKADREEIEAALKPLCRPVLVSVRRAPRWLDVLQARFRGRPVTAVRHTLLRVRSRVGQLLAEGSFDVVVAEQFQALGNVLGLNRGDAPLLWRAQNVESDLWEATSAEVPWARAFLAGEARRLATWEGKAVATADATLALTQEDAERLRELSGGGGGVYHLPAPFDADMPAAPGALDGAPPLVLFGSGGWRPNQSGEARFLREIWPAVHRHLPAARLHLFGGSADGLKGVEEHPRPLESRDAFAPGSVLVVPLWVASGVRMKILEAWARGVAVIATPTAARGLAARHGHELLIAEDTAAFQNAVERLAEPSAREALVKAGRRHLTRHHDLGGFGDRFQEVYASMKFSSTSTSVEST